MHTTIESHVLKRLSISLLLKFMKMILILLANKLKFLPEFVKGSNLPSLCDSCLQAFKLLGLILVAQGTNVIYEPFHSL